MTTMEKLFVQIFEKKRWIIDQVKHQAQLFDQHLASTLLIDGVPPPPWLLHQPRSSEPAELKKEDLISGLFFPFPQVSAPYSSNCNSVYDRPIFTADSEKLPGFRGDACKIDEKSEARGETSVFQDIVCSRGCALNGPTSLAFSPLAKSPQECAMNHVPQLIPTPTAKSPQDQREASVPDSYHSLNQSLARIQRSKSRQKDLELRNSAKASKSSLHDECHSGVNQRAVAGCGNGRLFGDRVDNMELVRPLGTDCNISSMGETQPVDCRSGGMGFLISSDRFMDPVVSGLQPVCIDESVKPSSSHSITEQCGAQILESSLSSYNRVLEAVESFTVHSNAKDSRGKEKNSSIFCGKIIRSQSSTRSYCEDEFSKLHDSCAVDREARILIEEAIHVNSTGKSKEGSQMQEAEIELFELDNDGLSRLHESRNTGGRKVYYSEDKLMQLQQLTAASGEEAKPLKPSILGSTVKQPTSEKLASAKLQTATNQENVSGTQVVILSGKRDGADPEGCSNIAAETTVVSGKPLEGFSARTRSKVDGDNLKSKAEVIVFGLSADCSVHVEPKQLDFGDAGESKSGLNEIASTASEERMQEDVPAPGLSNSLDEEECCLFSTEDCVEEMGEDSTTMRQDVAVLARDALETGRSLNSSNLRERDTSKDQFSLLENKVVHPFDGENVLQHPLNVVEHSSLSSLKAVVRMDLSVERSVKEFDTAKPSMLGSHESKVGYNAHAGDQVSAELKFGEPAGSSMSNHPDLILGDRAVEVHGSVPGSTGLSLLYDMNIDNSLCQSADPVENCPSGLQDGGCSKSDDHHIAENSVLSGDESSPHSGSSCPQSRHKTVGSGAELPTASSTWKIASLLSSHGNSPDTNLSGEECHQEYVPSPEKIISAHNAGAACSNASSYQVDLDEQKLEDYALERFRFSPMQQDGVGGPGPSFDTGVLTHNAADHRVILSGKTEMTGSSKNVIDTRTCTFDEVKDQEHGEDDVELGDAERSASSEGPVERKSSHHEESFELSSHLVDSPLPSMKSTHDDQMMHVHEGFFMQTGDEDSCLSKDACSFEKFDIRDTVVERASLIEQLCRSACLHTPSTLLSTASKLHKGSNLYQSVPNSLLECSDLKSTKALEDDIMALFKGDFIEEKVRHALDGELDCLTVSGAENGAKPYASPVGKLWEKINSNSGSSKDKASVNPELPCISEENEIADEATGTLAKENALAVTSRSAKRKPLADITEDPNCHASVSELENQRCSLESVNTEFSFCGTNKRPNQKLRTHTMSKKRHTSKTRDSKAISRGAGFPKIPTETLHNRVSQPKTSLQRDGLVILGKEAKRGNIVCNVTSFIPLVQQKQAAVPLTGKRDVKVKALEAAEAAKRQAEKREIERKMKKEALKLERARIEQENMRQLELQKKRKEEERKKREAEIATRKRLREEEERREKERKRKRVEGARKHQEEHKEKLCPKKEDKEIKIKATIGDEKKDVNLKTLSQNEVAKTRTSETVLEDGSLIPETPHHCSDKSKVTSFFNQEKDKPFKGDGIGEQSYEISPYQCSDDEDEDGDDENAPKKFIPSWASKNRIAQAISSQHRVDPDLILPPDSFCSIDEVVLPRKLRPLPML